MLISDGRTNKQCWKQEEAGGWLMEDADRWETEDQTHAGHEDKKKMARCLKLLGEKGKKNTQTWM